MSPVARIKADRSGRSDKDRWSELNGRIVACERCPRLRDHCQEIARLKRASYRDWDYWGKPVPNLGPADARLLIVGLAPGAHGANRTGRMFTGDRSGDFLYKALHGAGFANQPTATKLDDGLRLIDAAVTAACHCAPPDNKPTTEELAHCSEWFDMTFDFMPRLRVVLCLGGIALRAVLKLYQRRGWVDKLAPYKFAHGAAFRFDGQSDASGGATQVLPPAILCAYHPSQQNTFTGRLTEPMMQAVLAEAKAMIQGRR